MPKQVVETHISDQREAQIAQTVVAQYQSVRDASADVEDAQIDALRSRYEWGRSLVNAVSDLEQTTQTEFCEEVATRLDKSRSYVQHHISFARACVEEYVGYDPAVAGYIAEAQDTERRLTWSAAISWMSSSTGEDTDGDTEDLHHDIKEVERLIERLDEAADGLAEDYLGRRDSLDDSERQAIEGVLTRAQQALEDERHRMDELPDKAPERVKCRPYRLFIKEETCRGCGVDDETMVPHHYRPAEETGTATKPDDWYTLPCCNNCHRTIENGDEAAFWAERSVDPMEEIAQLQAKFLTLITQTE